MDTARLEAIADYVEIQQLAYRYAVSVDSRDIATLASLFAETEQPDGARVTRGQIAQRFGALIGRSPLTILNVGNHVIDLDPQNADRATGTVYCRAEIQDGERWLVQQIVYHDSYVREDGAWLFAARTHLLFYGSDLLTRPIGLAAASQPEVWDGKGSMPQFWPSYREFYREHPELEHY